MGGDTSLPIKRNFLYNETSDDLDITLRSNITQEEKRELPAQAARPRESFSTGMRRRIRNKEMGLSQLLVSGVRFVNCVAVTSVEFPRHSRITIYYTLVSVQFYVTSLFFSELPMREHLTSSWARLFAFWTHLDIALQVCLVSLPFSYFLAWSFKLGFSLRRISNEEEFLSTLSKQRVKLVLCYFLSTVLVGTSFVGIGKFAQAHG